MLNRKLPRRDVLATAAMMPVLAATRPASAQDRAALIEGAKREGKMSMATSVSQANFPKFMQAFTNLYPFLDVNSGYYAAPTGRVLARVEAEMRGGALSFDVLHVASMAPYLTYARDGKLLPYRSPELAAYPPSASDPGGNWTTARVIGVIMAYNKNYLPPEKAPKSWMDALKPEFAGRKLILQDAAAGTAFAQMYELERHFGTDYLKRLAAQKPMVVSTSAQVIDLLVRGEARVGFTVDHYRAFEPDAVKAGIRPIYPAEGMPIALAPIAIFRDAPHPNAAKLFVDFVLSHNGQTLLDHDIFQVYSMRPDVPPPVGQLPYAATKPMLPSKSELADYEHALTTFPERFEALFQSS
jgi:iron(III) transport system substrate-binding protein